MLLKVKNEIKFDKSIKFLILDEIYPMNACTGRSLYKVKDLNTHLFYSLKVFDLSLNTLIAIKKEIVALNMSLDIPEIFPKARFIFENQEFAYLLIDWCEGITLKKYLDKFPLFNKNEELDLNEFKRRLIITEKIFEAIMLMYNSKIIHRDMKPENIIIQFNDKKEFRKIMIIDFGLANQKRNSEEEGTPEFQSPEQFCKRDFNLTDKTDIFSLAKIICIFFDIRGIRLYPNDVLTNWKSMPEINLLGLFLEYHKKKKKFSEEKIKDIENINIDLNNAIRKCLSFNPSERPSGKELYYFFIFNVKNKINKYLKDY